MVKISCNASGRLTQSFSTLFQWPKKLGSWAGNTPAFDQVRSTLFSNYCLASQLVILIRSYAQMH